MQQSAEAEKPLQHWLFPGKDSQDRDLENKTHLRLVKTKVWMDVLSCDWHTQSLKTAASGLASYCQSLVSKRGLQSFGTVRHQSLCKLHLLESHMDLDN